MSPKPFTDFGLHPDILSGLEQMGYTHATPVQDAAIPLVQTGRDLMVQARTGTGKTLGFGLPTLQRIDPTSPDTQVLVICPTRELALQVKDELARVADPMRIIVSAVFGGVKIETQIDEMQWAPVVVGTPGRLRDHIERGYLHLDTCRVAVLDEADEMLDMGFKDDLEFILKRVPAEQRQTLLFSATFPPEIIKIAHKYMRDPEKIEVSSGYTPAVGLTHKFARVPKDKKIQALGTLLRNAEVASSIIFCETKVEAAWVHQRLKREGLPIGILTGDIPQERRLTTLQQFRDGELNILVATDVAARGLDIPAVSHIFHFTVPRDTATYIHRSGRTARAGKKGTAFTLVTNEEEREFQAIMRDIKQAQGGGAPQPAAGTRSVNGGAGGRERSERPERPERSERTDRPERGERQPLVPVTHGPRPAQPQPQGGGRARLTPDQAGTAAQIFQAVLGAATDYDIYRPLAEALVSRGDSRRILAALLSLAPQAENWLDVAEAAGGEAGQPEGEQARREGRRRRRGGRGRGRGDRGERPEGSLEGRDEAFERDEDERVRVSVTPAPVAAEPGSEAPVRRTRSTRAALAAPEAEAPAEIVEAPKRRTTRKPATEAAAAPEAAEAPRKRTTRKVAETSTAPEAAEAPKKRATRKAADEGAGSEIAEAPRKRATRKVAPEAPEPEATAAEAPKKRATRTRKTADVS
ncbi:MAG: DEAD/DEAH box helicase [Candidatus Sericytochromatia bacterium]|nr:DEAD/DEAH box helicase [Candidatus Sericytochromatia bacterium]